jgi:NAD(P)H dehydrogenase (quinone)
MCAKQFNWFTLVTLTLAICLAKPAVAEDIKILIAYHSNSGHTRQLAEAIRQGAETVAKVRVTLKRVEDANPGDFLLANAVIIGSPVHNGNITPQVQSFINSWPFAEAPYSDKVGAAFVTAGGISAGEEAAMHAIHRAMLIFGMVVVGGDSWRSAFGASAIVNEAPFSSKQTDDKLDPAFLQKGHQLGIRVARIASKLAN